MSNTSSHHEKNAKNTSSGQGAVGMGGQPDDDPRDMARGGDGRSYDDEVSGSQPVSGAFGSQAGAKADAKSASNEVVGPVSGPGAVPDVKAALDRSATVDPA